MPSAIALSIVLPDERNNRLHNLIGGTGRGVDLDICGCLQQRLHDIEMFEDQCAFLLARSVWIRGSGGDPLEYDLGRGGKKHNAIELVVKLALVGFAAADE